MFKGHTLLVLNLKYAHFNQSGGSTNTLKTQALTHASTQHTARRIKIGDPIRAHHAGLEQQAETEKRGGRSRRAEKARVLTDRNDYPQNCYCDVVTYEVVIACSWDETREREKKKIKK